MTTLLRVFSTAVITTTLMMSVTFLVWFLVLSGYITFANYEWESVHKPLSGSYQQIVINVEGHEHFNDAIAYCRVTFTLTDNEENTHSSEDLFWCDDMNQRGDIWQPERVEKWLVDIGVDSTQPSFRAEAKALQWVIQSSFEMSHKVFPSSKLFSADISN